MASKPPYKQRANETQDSKTGELGMQSSIDNQLSFIFV